MTAIELLAQLRGRGVIIEAKGERLRVEAPKGAMTPELREALTAHKLEVLALTTIAEDEIAWRVAAMLPQIPNSGPVPFLIARQVANAEPGGCHSCGEPLMTDNSYRCGPCSRAVNLALERALRGNLKSAGVNVQ